MGIIPKSFQHIRLLDKLSSCDDSAVPGTRGKAEVPPATPTIPTRTLLETARKQAVATAMTPTRTPTPAPNRILPEMAREQAAGTAMTPILTPTPMTLMTLILLETGREQTVETAMTRILTPTPMIPMTLALTPLKTTPILALAAPRIIPILAPAVTRMIMTTRHRALVATRTMASLQTCRETTTASIVASLPPSGLFFMFPPGGQKQHGDGDGMPADA
mmetsp:Transcript_32766/g.50836  ORF Transcript_32766/g.50836 Transcript_32766/m.50836 type:complete len:219 (+) Transcript_32766:186-842(+)